MGEKDITQKELEAFNDVFADVFNALLFKENFIEPEKLKFGVTNAIVETQKKKKEKFRDVCKTYENMSLKIASFGIENQSSIDDTMPLRLLGYDYGEYLSQLKNRKGSEIFYLYPSITVVLNFSNKKWNAPKKLTDCMQIDERLKPFFNDYKIFVFDVCDLTDEELNRMNSDLRCVLTIIRDGSRNAIKPEKFKYKFTHTKHSLDVITAFFNDDSYERAYYDRLKETEVLTVCEAFETLREQGRVEVIKDMLDNGKSVEEIMDFTGYSREIIEKAKE